MDWYDMEKEEVQDQLNDADKIEHFPVDILSYYWRLSDGMLILKTTELFGLSDKTNDAGTLRVDYEDNLTLFILNNSIGLKKTRENRNSWKAK